jgi:hypothetical protein
LASTLVARILQERAKSGVEVRIIGKASKRLGLKVAKLTKIRLHTRTILKDSSQAFIGSQSLREAELDSRREVGLIIRESKIVKRKQLDRFLLDFSVAGNDAKTATMVDVQMCKIE